MLSLVFLFCLFIYRLFDYKRTIEIPPSLSNPISTDGEPETSLSIAFSSAGSWEGARSFAF